MLESLSQDSLVPTAFPSPKPHPGSQPPSLPFWGHSDRVLGVSLSWAGASQPCALQGSGASGPHPWIRVSGRGANPSAGMQRGGGCAPVSRPAVRRAGGSRCANAGGGGGGLAPGCRSWAGGAVGRTKGRAWEELLWCWDFQSTSKGRKQKLVGK